MVGGVAEAQLFYLLVWLCEHVQFSLVGRQESLLLFLAPDYRSDVTGCHLALGGAVVTRLGVVRLGGFHLNGDVVPING